MKADVFAVEEADVEPNAILAAAVPPASKLNKKFSANKTDSLRNPVWRKKKRKRATAQHGRCGNCSRMEGSFSKKVGRMDQEGLDFNF